MAHTLAQPKRELAFRTLQNNFRAAMFLVYWCQKKKRKKEAFSFYIRGTKKIPKTELY